ncbi:hypothetical protein BBJ28_00023453 [Nothophytophthora sp. Chile5]|nr:hypothetical protein BBJ28_00023453 [Nothophytophthora sp. Chile5]
MAPSPSAAELPTQIHSNLFWSAPTEHRDSVPRLAVLLLNASHASWRITQSDAGAPDSDLFWNVWSSAQLTVCADGGANRLYDRGVELEAQDLVVPQYIKGDLDSIRDDVRDFYASKGTKVLHDAAQDTNDLDKCLQLIRDVQQQHQEATKTTERFSVLIFGAMGGRFDQEMQNINALFCWKDHFDQMVLLSGETTARLLVPGVRHVITPNFEFEGHKCGLIPVAGTCKETTTSGLKWNLSPGMEMGFGGLISSSNHVDDASEQVEVVASHPLIWTTKLKK